LLGVYVDDGFYVLVEGDEWGFELVEFAAVLVDFEEVGAALVEALLQVQLERWFVEQFLYF
jgi:hypothetical protein